MIMGVAQFRLAGKIIKKDVLGIMKKTKLMLSKWKNGVAKSLEVQKHFLFFCCVVFFLMYDVIRPKKQVQK